MSDEVKYGLAGVMADDTAVSKVMRPRLIRSPIAVTKYKIWRQLAASRKSPT